MGEKTRSYSHQTRDAAVLLGKLIQLARKERRMSVKDLADRMGASRGLIQRIETGNLKCELGVAFEAATILGVTLFNADPRQIEKERELVDHKLALLPKAIHRQHEKIDDDF